MVPGMFGMPCHCFSVLDLFTVHSLSDSKINKFKSQYSYCTCTQQFKKYKYSKKIYYYLNKKTVVRLYLNYIYTHN